MVTIQTYLRELEVNVDHSCSAQAKEDKIVFVANGGKCQRSRRVCGEGDGVVRTVRNGGALGSQVRRPNLGNVAKGSVVDEHSPQEDVDIKHSRGSIEARFVCGSEVVFLEHSLNHQDCINQNATNHW